MRNHFINFCAETCRLHILKKKLFKEILNKIGLKRLLILICF